MSFFDLLFGRPLANSEQRAEHIGAAPGVPIFGLDALTSAAYGPEAALALLIPLGIGGVRYIVPVSFAIIILLVIVFFSYRQTIDAYPNGGGSYTVASENLGTLPSLLAAAALMIDYVLTAAVGISAGVGALVSVDPGQLHRHMLALCLAHPVPAHHREPPRCARNRRRLSRSHISLRRHVACGHLRRVCSKRSSAEVIRIRSSHRRNSRLLRKPFRSGSFSKSSPAAAQH